MKFFSKIKVGHVLGVATVVAIALVTHNIVATTIVSAIFILAALDSRK